MTTVNTTKDNLEKTIAENEIVLVDFWASWCGPCRMFAPVFEKSSEKHQDITFAKVNTEEERELAEMFQIQSIPTLMVFRDQILLYAQPGALPETALEGLIEQIRQLDMEDVKKSVEDDRVSSESD